MVRQAKAAAKYATNGQFVMIGLPQIDPAHDRAMLCGSPAMLKELSDMLDARGFNVSPNIGTPGDYVIERAFVAKSAGPRAGPTITRCPAPGSRRGGR